MSSTLISILNPFFSIFGQKWPFGQTKIKFPSIFGKKANIFWDEKIVQKEREFLTLNRFEPEQGGLTYSNLTFKTYSGFLCDIRVFILTILWVIIMSHDLKGWKCESGTRVGLVKRHFLFKSFTPFFYFLSTPVPIRTTPFVHVHSHSYTYVHVRTRTIQYI